MPDQAGVEGFHALTCSRRGLRIPMKSDLAMTCLHRICFGFILPIEVERRALMITVGVTVAKRDFERLVERVTAGEEVSITRWGKVVARMVPVEKESGGVRSA
jgi:prevent-host-death family protein